jgi:hypothetical protein
MPLKRTNQPGAAL